MTTQFWLNNERIETDEHPGRLVLDYVRKIALTGTKEGCKEGDCGACTILIGELVDGSVLYQPVTSCLVPIGEVHGKHVVTIEGINFKDSLSPVQQSMVKFGGTQCGYCTPGFVVSMTWFLLDPSNEPTMEGFQRAISGNLCRCTGYSSINRAGEEIIDAVKGEIWNSENRLQTLIEKGFLPAYFWEMADRLSEFSSEPLNVSGTAVFIAGGTDLYVQRGEDLPHNEVAILDRYPDMKGIRKEGGVFSIGALTTFEDFGQDPDIKKLIPNMDHFLFLIASLQIRNRATLGGNIVNASPIGDMTQLLLSLGSTLVLKLGDNIRRVAMDEFFLGYKQLDKKEGELVTAIEFPVGSELTSINFEKVSKRKALDIASVCSGARFEVDGSGKILNANVTLGGVAATPLLLKTTRDFLRGKEINDELVRDALEVIQSEISPISDVRGSADYKRLLSQNLFIAHFAELFPKRVSFGSIEKLNR